LRSSGSSKSFLPRDPVRSRASSMPNVKLGDVCSIEAKLVDPTVDVHAGRVHVGGANIVSDCGELTQLQSAREEGVKSPKFLFTPNDVLYNKIRPYLRKAAWPQVTCVCSADIYPLRAGEKILPRYLQYLLLSDEFTSFAVRISNRAGMPKVNREQLFAYEFHLPSLGEQAADVALLDKVYERLAELQRLAVVRKRELWALKRSLVFGASPREREWVPAGEYVEWVRATETVSADVCYAFAGVKSFGGGVFKSVSRLGRDFSYKAVHLLRAGEFIYPKLMAWEGAFGLVAPDYDGLAVSPEFVVFRTKSQEMLPEVLDTYFRSPASWPRVQAASTGTNRRRRRLHPRAFLTLEIPRPPRKVQSALKQVYDSEARLEREASLVPGELAAIRSAALSRVFAGGDSARASASLVSASRR
jgi:type I restriction enzyme, S subunit